MSKDYYSILGIERGASIAEIKRAYRRKAKELHPDLHPQTPHERMRELTIAYRVLTNPQAREAFDSSVPFTDFTASKFDYRSFLREQGDDASHAKLIFYDLLNFLEQEAVDSYLQLRSRPQSFNLFDSLDREDSMDCAYILAEELETRDHLPESFELFAVLAEMECDKPYFKFFFPEVILHLRSLFANRLPKILSADELCRRLDRILKNSLPAKDRAWFLRQAAENWLKRNQRSRALLYIEESLRLDPKAPGISELRRKLSNQP